MVHDEELRAKLAKVEALFRRAGSPGERAAAAAAMGRLGCRNAHTTGRFCLPRTYTNPSPLFSAISDHTVGQRRHLRYISS